MPAATTTGAKATRSPLTRAAVPRGMSPVTTSKTRAKSASKPAEERREAHQGMLRTRGPGRRDEDHRAEGDDHQARPVGVGGGNLKGHREEHEKEDDGEAVM